MVASAVVSDSAIAFLLVTGLCSGMSIISCGFVVLTQGPSFNLTGDRTRQRFLAFVALLAAIFGVIANGLDEGRLAKSVGHSVLSVFFNWLVEVGLVVILHNSVIRFVTAVTHIPDGSLKRISWACCGFYFLTVPVLTPTFISLVTPADATVTIVSRYMNIIFVVIVEVFASLSDFLLLRRFVLTRRNFSGQRQGSVSQVTDNISRGLWVTYVAIWLSICADITAKIVRNQTGILISDLAITNLTLALRAMANINYGQALKDALDYTYYPSSRGPRRTSLSATLEQSIHFKPGSKVDSSGATYQGGTEIELSSSPDHIEPRKAVPLVY